MNELRLDFAPGKPGSTKGVLLIFGAENTEPLHSDTLDIASNKMRKQFIEDVTAAYPAIPKDRLEAAILEKVAEILAGNGKANERAGGESAKELLEDTPREVRDAAMAMLRSEDLFERICADIAAIGVAGEEELALMLYIVMTSRLLDRPLSAIVQGASASGKSYIIETVAKLMPLESVLQAHDFSDQALFYLPTGSLVHKVVISGERVHEHRGKDGYAEDNTKAFREMVASGELRKVVTIKGPSGKPETAKILQPGPIAYLESSTATNIHDEDATRLLPLVTDESPAQTQKIVEAQRREAKGQTTPEAVRQQIIHRHHTLQRLLQPLAVRIPYSDSISLPETNIATRRTYQQFRYAISSIALLRQHQKAVLNDENTGQQYIEADETDYAIACGLMQSVLARKYSPLNQQSRDLLATIMKHVKPGDEFTQKECEEWSGQSNTTVRRRLGPLVSVGILSADVSSKPYRYKVANAQLAEPAYLELPTPDDIAERVAIMAEPSGDRGGCLLSIC